MNDPFAKVLDLARKASGSEQEFVGEFHPDQEEVKAWASPLSQEDNGEFRYANKSPTELRRMIEEEQDPVEKAQMVKIMDQFIAKKWAALDDPRLTQSEGPYRGEPKPDIRPESIRKMGQTMKTVSHVLPVGNLDVGNMGDGISEMAKNGEGLGMVQGPGGIWEEE